MTNITYDQNSYYLIYTVEPNADCTQLVVTNSEIHVGDPNGEVYTGTSLPFANFFYIPSPEIESESTPDRLSEVTSIPIKRPTPTPRRMTSVPIRRFESNNSILLAKMTTKGGTSLSLTWTKVNGADGYDIFFAKCGKHKTIERVDTVLAGMPLKWTKKGLEKNTAYRAYVRACVVRNGRKVYVKTSPEVHAYTSGGDKYYTNAKRVKVKKASIPLKKGKKYKINADIIKQQKQKKIIPRNHAPKLRYMSSKKKVAIVNKSGKITAKSKGTCTIYVFAPNGVSRAVKVTVR